MIGRLQVAGASLILPKSILPEDNDSTLLLHIRQLASCFRKHLQLSYMGSDRFQQPKFSMFTHSATKVGNATASLIAFCLSVARTHHLSCTSPALLLLYPHVKERKAICKILVHKTKCNSIYSKAHNREILLQISQPNTATVS